jgi:hypothetical protein
LEYLSLTGIGRLLISASGNSRPKPDRRLSSINGNNKPDSCHSSTQDVSNKNILNGFSGWGKNSLSGTGSLWRIIFRLSSFCPMFRRFDADESRAVTVKLF